MIRKLQVPPVRSSTLVLLELNDELGACLEDGQELLIKGASDEDELVLCTPSHTFSVRQMASSNLSLLVEETTGQVMTMTSSLLEAVKCPPRLERLRHWLASCPYDGPEKMDDMVTDMDANTTAKTAAQTHPPRTASLDPLRADRILEEIQASDQEIRQALVDQAAVLIDGHYRCLGAELTCRLFKSIFAGITLRDRHAREAFDRHELLQCLGNGEADEEIAPLSVLEHFLSLYTRERRGEGETMLEFDEMRVCRFFVQELLRARAVWTLSELMRAWRQLTGDLVPDPHRMLVGLALLEPIPGQEDDLRVTYFPAAKLPLEPVALFGALFERRLRWEYGMLEPYVEEAACCLGLSAADLIVRHGRISVEPISQRRIVTPLLAPM